MKKNLLITGCILLFLSIVLCSYLIYKKLQTIKENTPSKSLDKIIKSNITPPKVQTNIKSTPPKYLLLIFKTIVKSSPSEISPDLFILDPFKKVKAIKYNKDKKWVFIKTILDNNTIKGWIPKYNTVNFSYFKIKKNTFCKIKENNSVIRSSPDKNFKKLIVLNKNEKVKIIDSIVKNNCIPVEVDIDKAIIKGWIKIDKIYMPKLDENLVNEIKKNVNEKFSKENSNEIASKIIEFIKENYFKIALEKIQNINDVSNDTVKKDKILPQIDDNNSTKEENNNNTTIRDNNSTIKPKKVFYVYVGPFPKYKDTFPLIKKLKKNKIDYFISKGKLGYYVQLGTYREKYSLLAIQKKLKQAGIKNATIKSNME